jgi:hypothetical protein
MKLPPRAIRELQEILRQNYGREFDEVETEDIGLNLLETFRMLGDILSRHEREERLREQADKLTGLSSE